MLTAAAFIIAILLAVIAGELVKMNHTLADIHTDIL